MDRNVRNTCTFKYLSRLCLLIRKCMLRWSTDDLYTLLTGLCPDQDNVLLSDGVPKTCYVDTDCEVNSFGCIKGHCCPKGQVSTVAPGTSSSYLKSTVKLVKLNVVHCSMFFYLSKLFSPWTCPYHFCLIILFWTSGSSLVCNPLGTLIHSLLPVSVNYLPYLAVFDEDPRTDLMQIIHLAIIASLFSLCINNSKTLNSNHEICSGAL